MMSADQVRQAIRRLEVGVVNHRGKGRGVLDLLTLRDDVERALEELENSGLDVRPERTRLAFVDGKTRNYARRLVREMGGPGVLAKARQERRPPDDYWWWFLDEILVERAKRAIKSALTSVAAILLILGGFLIADRIWGLSPEERQARAFILDGEALITEGQLEEAIPLYEKALALTPEDPEVLLYLGLLYQEAGRQEEAEATFAAAQEQLGDKVEFYVNLAQTYVNLGMPDRTVEVANQALELDDQNARAYYVRSTGYELQDEVLLALEDLERAAELSHEVNDTLYVMARTRYANLLERASAIQWEQPAEE